MWPRSEERGNIPQPAAPHRLEIQLQCGRAPRSAEIIVPAAVQDPEGLASMWPRSEERGNLRSFGDRCHAAAGFNVAALRGARK